MTACDTARSPTIGNYLRRPVVGQDKAIVTGKTGLDGSYMRI